MKPAPSPPLPALGALLHQRLASIPCLHQAWCCALLNHPGHGNLGDHLIWAGQLHDLEHIRRLPVRYTAAPGLPISSTTFEDTALHPLALIGLPLVSHAKVDLFEPLVTQLWREGHARLAMVLAARLVLARLRLAVWPPRW
jgi:hypothetical protein